MHNVDLPLSPVLHVDAALPSHTNRSTYFDLRKARDSPKFCYWKVKERPDLTYGAGGAAQGLCGRRVSHGNGP